MAQALVTPLIESGQFGAASMRAAVASEASCQRLAASGLQVSTNPEAAWACPVVVLAVKPQQLEAAASAAGGQGGLLISVLAGVRLQRLQELFPQWRCVRAVPNTPALVRSGLTGLAWGPGVEAGERTWVRQLFGQVGEVHELPEAQLDPFLALTSSGPIAPWRVAPPCCTNRSCIRASSRTWSAARPAPPWPASANWNGPACARP